MIEITQAMLGADGRSPLPGFLAACEGRCVGAHFGTYDYTASCNITAAYQAMDHPGCDLAKGMMLLAFAGTGDLPLRRRDQRACRSRRTAATR